jgi:hypothetical protein
MPSNLLRLLDGTDLAERQGLTFLLLTTDDAGWPHLAMLSVGELVAQNAQTLLAALWLHSSTTHNLDRHGRGVLAMVAEGAGYSVRCSAGRGPDLDLGEQGRLAAFVLTVEDVLEDVVSYASLTSGVTFRLNQPDQVLPRWRRTIDALQHGYGS